MNDLRHPHYAEVEPSLSGNRQLVYNALVLVGSSTPIELAARMGWDKTSVRPRISELRDMGLVVATGERRHGEHVFHALAVPQQRELKLTA